MLIATAGVCNATIDWYYDSPLTVYETITDIGGGDYRYEYSFENVDDALIHSFGVYTEFVTDGENTFTGHPTWIAPISALVTDFYPEYDARNLNPDILYMNASGYEWYGINPSYAIAVDEEAYGFSYISSVFDSTPKYYQYETIASGNAHTNGTGKVAAVGTTIPEPTTILLFGMGGLVLRCRKS